MRVVSQLYVFACILTLLTVGCSAGDPVGPEAVEREAALSDDPCFPNATPGWQKAPHAYAEPPIYPATRSTWTRLGTLDPR